MPSKTKLLLPWTLIAGLVAAAGSLSPVIAPPAAPLGLEKNSTDSPVSFVERPAELASFGETNRARREPQAPASVQIAGPAETSPGDLVILEARGEYEGIRWILGNSPKSFLPVDEGRRCVFASGAPGEYRFFAVVAQRDGDRTTLADASFVVRVGGPTPTPTPVPPSPTPPTPTPTPVPPSPPAPVIPDDAFGNVGRLAFDTVSKFGPSARSKSPATGSLYCEAAARLAGDGDPARLFVNVSAAVAWLKQERTTTWGNDATEWQAFVDAVSKPWNERWPMDKATAAEFLDAVGKALKAVKS